MLISALKSTMGEPNSLKLPAKRSVCVILVDGLGSHNLKSAGAHSSFLNSQPSEPAMSWFPATTATSIASFATASNPWENGFLGYQVFDRTKAVAMNLLSGWPDYQAGSDYQERQTVSEMAVSNQIGFHTVAPSAYARSGFTGATMRGIVFHGEDQISNRFKAVSDLLKESSPKIVYLYIPELDQLAHAKGSASIAWLNQLENLDAQVREFAAYRPKNAGILLTADHGVVDVDSSNHIFLDDLIPKSDFEFVGGDTRSLFLYFKNGTNVETQRQILETQLGDSCYVSSPEEIIEAGYWKPLSSKSRAVLPDLVVMARKRVALYHRGFAKTKSMQMIGHHGSITNEELAIPLIKIGF